MTAPLRRSFVIGLIAATVAGCGSVTPSRSPEPTSASEAPDSSARTAPPPPSDTWQLITIDAGVPASLLADVIATDDGVIAVGADVTNQPGAVALSSRTA